MLYNQVLIAERVQVSKLEGLAEADLVRNTVEKHNMVDHLS